jgi:mannose-6-phosphate isomerase-like protein (cupin superfamily)
MNRFVVPLSIAAAFAAGCGFSHLVLPARAAETMTAPVITMTAPVITMTAQVIHLPELTGDALSPASASGLRSKTLVSADGVTISVQDGNVRKHIHANANEIQYILEGTGTVWLGDHEVQVKPGDLIIIPKGTPHAGTKPDGRPFKSIAIKTPPQAPDDMKVLD